MSRRVVRAFVLLASLVTFGLTTAGPVPVVEASAPVEADVTSHEGTGAAVRTVVRRPTGGPAAHTPDLAGDAASLDPPTAPAPRPAASAWLDDGPPRGPPSSPPR